MNKINEFAEGVVLLQNPQFSMNFGGGHSGDTWMLGGTVFNHPSVPDGEFVHVSTPKAYNKETNEMLSFSGKTYILDNPTEEVEKEILEVIENGGYSRH